MSEIAGAKVDGGNGWGWLAVAVLLAFVAWQSGVVGKWLNRPETVNQAWFENYQDRYLSDVTTVRVSGRANQRAFPTAQGTQVVGAYADGTRLKGRWVRGADPKILWFKVGDGIYLWEGNLKGDAKVMADARQAAQGAGKAGDEPSEAAGALVDARPSGPVASAAPATTPAPAASASAAPQQGFDAATAAAVRRAVGDDALAAEIVANAEVVAPSDQQGATRLTWAMCADRCGYDFSSAVVLTGTGGRPQVQVCVHDSRRMAGQSDWYEPGKPPARRPGLCPSTLAGM